MYLHFVKTVIRVARNTLLFLAIYVISLVSILYRAWLRLGCVEMRKAGKRHYSPLLAHWAQCHCIEI
jgi:hypothetical protein